MKKIYFSIITLLFFITGSFAQTVVVTGADATTFAGNPYSTLKAAFDKINLVSQAGNNIIITITGTTVETASAALNQSVGAWASVTIVPVGLSSVTGNIAGPLVNLSGADNVTINGLNLAGNSLAIDNSNTGGGASTIQFVNDASSNTITNCSLLGACGSATGSGLGTIYFSSGLTTGNDNNTITQCNISSSGSGNPINAIFSIGSFGSENNDEIISVNNISDYFNPTATSCGLNIASFSSGWTIINNTFYQTATRIATNLVGNSYYGIYIGSGVGYNISNNVIGFAAPNATGTTNLIGVSSGLLGGTFPGSFTNGSAVPNPTRFVGINCFFTAGGAASSIQNNRIGGIALYTSYNTVGGTGALGGIAVFTGNANIGNITGNTVGSTTGISSLYVAGTAAGASVSGIYVLSSDAVTVQNNTVGAVDVSGTSATTAAGFKGIDVTSAGAGIFTVNNNTIGNSTPNNIRTGYFLTGGNLSNTATTATAASGSSQFYGILRSGSAGAGTITMNNNILQGFLISGSATSFTGLTVEGSAAGTTININNNQLGTVAAGLLNMVVANTGAVTGIINNNSTAANTVNITDNSVQGISCVSSGDFVGITNSGSATDAINITGNQLGTATGDLITYSAATSNTIREIFNNGGTGNCTLTIQSNSVRGIVHTVAATSFHIYISNTAIGLASVNINSNTFINLNVNTTGNVTFIADAGGLTATGTSSCSGNTITTAFNKAGASGNIYVYTSGGNNVNGSVMTETGNNFSNITMSGSGTLFIWQNAAGVSSTSGPTRTVSSNTFNNISGGSGAIIAMILNVGGPTNCSSNTITNITGTGSITAISIGTANGPGTHTYAFNTISSLVSSGTGGSVRGISGGPGDFSATYNVNSNNITGLSSTGASSAIEAIRLNTGLNIFLNDNSINNLSGSGTTNPKVRGIVITGGPADINMYRNKITNLQVSGAITTAAPAVLGIEVSGTDAGGTIANNFIAALSAPATNYADAIQGMRFDNSIFGISAFGVNYNSIYINANSTGTNFGTTGIYHTSDMNPGTGILSLVDNIIVNTSTPNGIGKTVALRRSTPDLDNYSTTSDNNLVYAGTPSATRLIYYDGVNSDQTLATFKTRVSPREANSISLMPVFVSATDLHLTNANCGIDGKGKPVPFVTTDIDGDTRNAIAPDIGADEFTATYSTTLAGVAGSVVCDTRTVATAPAVTTYATNACDLIAKILPSGGSPVAGRINVCVTIDATPQTTFNGQPYVQRHYDIEPAVTNQTTTSATITLYFTDAEFTAYNTNNPVWPKLPTFANGGNASPFKTNVKVTQFHGVASTSPSSPGNYPGVRLLITPLTVNYNGTYWELTFNVAGFSGFYVHTNGYNAPLPIIVNYLTGRRQGSNHLLNWKVTCTTSSRATMTLERSADSRNYTGINTITADAARCQQPFDYTDANPLSGMNYYRLKIVDADGKVTYSTTVALLNAVKGFDIISIAPNPVVDDNFKLNVASALAGKMEIVIFDMQGRLVNRQSLSVIAGFNSLPVNVASLAAGTYTIKGSMAEDQSKVIRFVKQ